MKILQVAKKFPWPPKDGESIAINSMTRGYQQAGHEVVVLAMSTPKHSVASVSKEELLPNGRQAFRPDEKALHEDRPARSYTIDVDTRIRILPALLNLFTRYPYNLERFFSQDFKEGLTQLIAEENFDLIQFEGLFLAPYLNTVRKVSTVPVVMRSHNVEYRIWERMAENESHPLKKSYFRLLSKRLERFERETLNAFSALLPISPVDEKTFKEMGATLPMCYMPVSLPMESYTACERHPVPLTIGYLGALDWLPNRDGVDWFLEQVWPQIRTRVPQARLRIAGRNAPPEWLARSLDGVEFLGEIEDARRFLSEQSIVILPLRSGSGMRIKLIEALALGAPVVSTRQGAEGVAVQDGLHCRLADSPEAFRDALLQWLSDPKSAASSGREGRRWVQQHFDLEKSTYQLLDFYAQQWNIR